MKFWRRKSSGAGPMSFWRQSTAGVGTLDKMTILAVVFLVFTACHSSVAPEQGQARTVDGVTIYYGILPAEIMGGPPLRHADARADEATHHLVVALFNAETGTRIVGAEVSAGVEQPGHLGASEKKLEPMDIAGKLTYGNYFEMSGEGPFLITIKVRMHASPEVAEATFQYGHY